MFGWVRNYDQSIFWGSAYFECGALSSFREASLQPGRISTVELLCENSYFCKKATSCMFGWVRNYDQSIFWGSAYLKSQCSCASLLQNKGNKSVTGWNLYKILQTLHFLLRWFSVLKTINTLCIKYIKYSRQYIKLL